MTSDLSAAAIEQLRVLATKGAMQISQTPDMQPLWDHRLVMGDRNKAHVTIAGQSFIRKLDAH